MNKKINKLLQAFSKAYSLPEAKELLSPRWKAENDEAGAPASTGFCYIAAEAMFHFIKKMKLKPTARCASYEEEGEACTHWWVVVNNKIVDPTACQYTELGEDPPYHLGRRMGFLTNFPSKRAAKLMKLVSSLMK